MNVLRRIGVWALVSVFFSSLLFFAYGFTFNETFGRRETVKAWFEKSGAYDNFVTELVSLSQAQAAKQGNVIDAKILSDVANRSFTPEVLQTALEAVLDGSYDWLEGNTESIEFVVDFTEAKNVYADELARVAQDRVDELPVCPASDVAGAFDPFTAPCRPAQLDFEPLAVEFRQLIYEDENFLPETVLTADTLTPEAGDEKKLDEAVSFMPTAYLIARLVTFIALLGAFISMILLIMVAKSKRKAIFKLSRGFIFTALSLALFTFVSSRSTGWIDNVLPIDPAAQGFTERVVKPLVSTATTDLNAWTFRFMMLYAAIGFIFLAVWGYLYTNGKQKVAAAALRTEAEFLKLEQAYRKRVAKNPRKYKKINEKRKEKLKKKQQIKAHKK